MQLWILLYKAYKQLRKQRYDKIGKKLLADFMAFGGSLLGDRVDEEGFKRNLEYGLSHNEA